MKINDNNDLAGIGQPQCFYKFTHEGKKCVSIPLCYVAIVNTKLKKFDLKN